MVVCQGHHFHVMYMIFPDLPDINDESYEEHEEDRERDDGPDGHVVNLFEIVFKHGSLVIVCYFNVCAQALQVGDQCNDLLSF